MWHVFEPSGSFLNLFVHDVFASIITGVDHMKDEIQIRLIGRGIQPTISDTILETLPTLSSISGLNAYPLLIGSSSCSVGGL